MGQVRFVAPVEDLELSGVPAVFSGFICDIDDTDTIRLARMRFLGSPYGIEERGLVGPGDENGDLLTESRVASGITNPGSIIGSAVGIRIEDETADLQTQVGQLQTGMDDLLSRPDGSGVIIGVELPAELDSGTLAARLRTY
jgi:hypothetical protein